MSDRSVPLRPDQVPASTAWRVLIWFALGYFVSYLYRSINVGLAPVLIRDMGLTAADLGLLTGVYYLAFAAVQLPAGILLDTYGPRRVNAWMMVIAAAGTVIFGLAQGFGTLMLGRILVGVGVAVCLGAAFKALAAVFPLSRLPLVTGLVMGIGGMGGVVVGTPLAELLQVTSWRVVSIGLAGLTLLVALGIALGARSRQTPLPPPTSLAEQARGTWEILCNLRFWQAATLPITSCGAFYAVQTLWLAPWLRDVEQLPSARIALLVSVLGLAMVGGNVMLGAFARRLERWGLGLYQFAGLCMTLFIVVQILLIARVPMPEIPTWIAFGVFGSASILTYSIMAERFPHAMLGRVGTTLTLVSFLLIFICQVGIGWILALWPVQPDGHYPVQAHLVAWSVMLVPQLLSAIWYWWPGAKTPAAPRD